MMMDPPIDELADKMGGNKYRVCCVASKRAKELEKRIPEELEKSDKKAITIACEEIFNGSIVGSDNDDKN